MADFDESDKAMLEAMGVHRVVRLLFEMRVLNGPVWGDDANGSLFLGWCEAESPDNVAAQIDRDGNWGKQDLATVGATSDTTGNCENVASPSRPLGPLCPGNANDPAADDGVAGKAQPRAGGSS